MAGPLARVNTKVEAINLDVSRKLNWGRGIIMEFLTVDKSQTDGWKIELTLRKGFDRVPQDEKTRNDGSDVLYDVADLTGDIGTVLRKKDLYVRVDNQISNVAKVPPVAPNVAQVYRLECKTRTLRTTFDNTRK